MFSILAILFELKYIFLFIKYIISNQRTNLKTNIIKILKYIKY